jgi:formate hydrogenlyase subunit 6/NADH:ubiquinone oxidoreductase subunit I
MIFKSALHRLFRKPVTALGPIPPAESYKGVHKYTKEKCIFCGACVRVCPSNAISVSREEKRWSVDLGRCVFCAECERVCPVHCLELSPVVPEPVFKRKEMFIQ